MSKEEIILQQQILKYPNKYIYQVAITAMKIHADQEKEKVAVAFAEWNHKEVIKSEDVDYCLWDDDGFVFFKTMSELYKYFIENIYNK